MGVPLTHRRWHLVPIVLACCSAASLFLCREGARRVTSTSFTGTEPMRAPPRDKRSARSDHGSSVHEQSLHTALISGLLQRRGGKPIGGGLVCLVSSPTEPVPTRCVASDDAGAFVLRDLQAEALSRAELTASAAGYLPRQQPLQLGDGKISNLLPVLIVLDPGGEKMSGQVHDVTGGPVIGAALHAEAPTPFASDGVALSGTLGEFELTLVAGATRICAQADGYARTCLDSVSPSTNNDLALVPQASIAGHVVAHDGTSPVAHATVRAMGSEANWSDESFEATSAPDGSFELAVAPGTYRVVAIAPGLRSQEEQLRVALGSRSDSIVLSASRAGSIDGVVRVAGSRCEHGYVAVDGPIVTRVAINAAGTVNIDGLPVGKYEATVACAGAVPAFGSLDVIMDIQTVTWNLEPVRAADTSMAALLKPLGSIRARMDFPEQSMRLAVFAAQSGITRRGVRQGDEFVFEQLEPGEYQVFAGDAKDRATLVAVTPGDHVTRVVVRPGPIASLAGRVLGKDGESVPDAWVTHFQSDEPPGERRASDPVVTDEEGHFTFAAAPGVTYSVVANGPSGMGMVDDATSRHEIVIILDADR